MAKVQVCNVNVLNNPSPFNSPFQFELTFECIEELQEDLEWKMIYVGSAESEEHDQVLDTIYVGPVPEGRHMFVFEADPPDPSKIPVADAIGVTVVLLTCSYKKQEFVRVGYFINNEYNDPEMKENPPTVPEFDKVTRNILGTEPRVTRFKINWDDSENGQVEPDTSNDTTPLTFSDNSCSQTAMEDSCTPPWLVHNSFSKRDNAKHYIDSYRENALSWEVHTFIDLPKLSDCLLT